MRRSIARRGGRLGYARRRLEPLEQRRLLAAFTVNSTADTVDADPGNGVALDAAGNTTLRAAIMEANAWPDDDTIELPAGHYLLSIPATSGGDAYGDLDITDGTGKLTITGAGSGSTIIDADGVDRVLIVYGDAELEISGVTITGGVADDDGGPIYEQFGAGIYNNHGTLTVTDSTIEGNHAARVGGGICNESSGSVTITRSILRDNSAASGGGLYNDDNATAIITSATFDGNSADNLGGGINNFGGVLTITDSTLGGNSAVNGGGGIFNLSNTTIAGSTLSGNTTGEHGGGIWNAGSLLAITDSTLSGNSADDRGGGISNFAAAASMVLTNTTITANWAGNSGPGVDNREIAQVTNTIIAGNLGPFDVFGGFDSLGNNLIGRARTLSGFVDGTSGDQVGTIASPIDLFLGPLQDNGGPTATHALLPGSAAIDAGNNGPAAATDQRGMPRILDGDGDGPAIVDVGAFEFEMDHTPTGIALSPAGVAENGTAGTAVGTLTTADPDPGDVFTYALVNGPGDDDNAAFTVSGDQLETAKAFDFEARSSYSVRVRSTDSAGLWRDEPMAIAVTDVDEIPPTVTGYSLKRDTGPDGSDQSTGDAAT